ncbi:MAG: ribosome biogenesis GTP-binding protein YihA/YsxC [Acidobacteriota bacterium]|nr:ribosome biogenesis GTP-binding protein YihA/YsxC [Acidobacteriota bacterium]
MKVVSAFVTSAAGTAGFPHDGVPELAMVGRSNVGKSTLINALVRQKLARTSAAPGKTRLANFYRVAVESRPPFYLVDLPGYGYARGGEKSRQEFDALAAEYFSSRHAEAVEEAGQGKAPTFCGVLALVDSRHPGLDADRIAWTWLSRMGIERHVVATKLDKLTRAERHRHLSELERLYSSPVTPVSAETGEGLDALWTLIARLLKRP